MAKSSSSAWKRKRPSTRSFSEMEMDVARQLMLLCQEYSYSGCNFGDNNAADQSSKPAEKEGSQSSGRRSIESFSSAVTMDQYPLEADEDDHLQPRKRRFKSIDLLYSSTKPLIIQNGKKMKV